MLRKRASVATSLALLCRALAGCVDTPPRPDASMMDHVDVAVDITRDTGAQDAPSDAPSDAPLDAPLDALLDAPSDAPVDRADVCEHREVCDGVLCGETVTDRCGRPVRCGPEPCPTIAAPTLLAPHNGHNTGRAGTPGNALRGTPLRPVFRWNPVASATRYEAQWTSSCTSPGFATCAFAGASAQSTTETTLQPSTDLVVSSAQPVGRRYYWRVRACLGTSVCSAWSEVRYLNVGRVDSDFNGDGFSDVVVGANRAAPRGMLLAGTATIFHGSAAGVAATPARLLEGPSVSASFGYSVASAGDVNADGYGDLLVGAYGANVAGQPNAGTTALYLGSASGIGSAATQVVEGVSAGEGFGISVAGAGDVDADGLSDIVVGAYRASPGGRAEAGAASLFLGTSTGVSTTASRRLEGVTAGDFFGFSVASAGDLNSDGFSDLVIGAYLADPGGMSAAGSSYVFLGGRAGVAATATRVIAGAGLGEMSGGAVAGVGDVNGDGYGDLLLGVSRASPGGRAGAGAAALFLGSNSGIGAAPSRVLEGSAAGDIFGSSLQAAGDVNNDGYADLLVGAYFADPGGRTDAGTASLFLGGAAGIGATAARVIEGAQAQDRLGFGIAGAGDVNGDGFSDIVVGAYRASPSGRAGAGTAAVFHGGATGIDATAARVIEGLAGGDNFGVSVARARVQTRSRGGRTAATYARSFTGLCGRVD